MSLNTSFAPLRHPDVGLNTSFAPLRHPDVNLNTSFALLKHPDMSLNTSFSPLRHPLAQRGREIMASEEAGTPLTPLNYCFRVGLRLLKLPL